MTKRSDVVLPPGTYAYILDRETAQLSVLVGPIHKKLEGMQGTVLYSETKGRTVGCPIDRAVQPLIVVPTGSYAIVTNPHIVEGKVTQPPQGQKTAVDVPLKYGSTVHIEGPDAIVPWPGQTVTIAEGYRLGRNQYVVVDISEEKSVRCEGMCTALEIEQRGRQVIRGDHLADRCGTDVFVPPTGMQMPAPIRRAIQLDRFEWCRITDQDGIARFERGPATIFPSVGETTDGPDTAYNLYECGLLIRSYNDGVYDERFVTLFGDESEKEPDPFYWPRADEEIVKVVEPVVIENGRGVYVKRVGQADVVIYDKPGPVLFNPLEFETCKRGSTIFAQPVEVPANEATLLRSREGDRILVGPTCSLLRFDEKNVSTVKLVKAGDLLHLKGRTADTVVVDTDFVFTSELTDFDIVFSIPSRHYRIHTTLQRAFADFVAGKTSLELDAGEIVQHLLGVEVPGTAISDPHLGPLKFDDAEISDLWVATRRNATVDRLTGQEQDREIAAAQARNAHAMALAEQQLRVEEAKAEAAKIAATAKSDMERLALEQTKSRQDLMDEIATYELDREARRAQQRLDVKAKENELEREMIAALSAAQVQQLAAIQPEMIAAIRSAGANASFAKVVQHLGPTSILQGMGLQDAVKRILGDDAAAAMVLTGNRSVDKPNGSKRQES